MASGSVAPGAMLSVILSERSESKDLLFNLLAKV
jgi:hypothetical protein